MSYLRWSTFAYLGQRFQPIDSDEGTSAGGEMHVEPLREGGSPRISANQGDRPKERQLERYGMINGFGIPEFMVIELSVSGGIRWLSCSVVFFDCCSLRGVFWETFCFRVDPKIVPTTEARSMDAACSLHYPQPESGSA